MAVNQSGCSVVIGEVDGFQTVEVGNGRVKADILPELGGKIWNLWDLGRDVQWLWHNPHVQLGPVRLGASYDDNWAGGWEELFPNDAAADFMGRELPDHGEWWSQPWEWEVLEDSSDRVSILMHLDGAISGTRCEKWVALESNAPWVSIRYRITNMAAESLYFLFKQHLALAVTPEHRLELPGGKVVPVDLGFSTLIGSDGPFEWPKAQSRAGEVVDLSTVLRETAKAREFVYVAQLAEGWCGARDTHSGATLRLHYSQEFFPYTWLFMTFGGWRGLYTVVLEPCTNMPKDLSKALGLGQCGVLAPWATKMCEVRAELS